MPLAGRRRAVVEHMAEMAAAAAAVHLGARQEQLVVGPGADRVRQRLVEARPAGAAVELGRRRIEVEIAAGAGVDTRTLLVQQVAGEGPFGRLAAENGIGGLAQPLAPFLVAERELEFLRLGRIAAPSEQKIPRRAGSGEAGEDQGASVHAHGRNIGVPAAQGQSQGGDT